MVPGSFFFFGERTDDLPAMMTEVSDNACGEFARDALPRHEGNASALCAPVERDQYGRSVARCYARVDI
jgi:endonuclease YncB( thermonuclease family)